MSSVSSCGQLCKSDEPLFASISQAVKTVSDDDEQQDLLFIDSLQRLRGYFYNGATEKMANHIIDCIVEMGSVTAMSRKNGSLLFTKLSNELKISANDKSFKEILIENTLSTFTSNIELIRISDFALGAYDRVLFYTELFMCFMRDNKKKAKGFVIQIKKAMIVLLENKIGSLKCLVNIIKIAGCKLYEAESHFGFQVISMDQIFELIKDVIVVKEGTDRCTRRMLLSVVELRAAQWGDVVGPLNKRLFNKTDVEIGPIYVEVGGDNLHMLNYGGDSGLIIPSFVTNKPLPEMSGDQINYMVRNNYMLKEEINENMTSEFEKFSLQ